jgi:PAS domain S-box-containing protein
MEHTFLTIHNLHPDANILYASDSIFEILGYSPQEVLGRSAFEYFHPEEIPYARSVHSRGVLLDKAAVLHYARLRSRDGRWVSSECVFSIVHDILFACISIYRCDAKSESTFKPETLSIELRFYLMYYVPMTNSK